MKTPTRRLVVAVAKLCQIAVPEMQLAAALLGVMQAVALMLVQGATAIDMVLL